LRIKEYFGHGKRLDEMDILTVRSNSRKGRKSESSLFCQEMARREFGLAVLVLGGLSAASARNRKEGLGKSFNSRIVPGRRERELSQSAAIRSVRAGHNVRRWASAFRPRRSSGRSVLAIKVCPWVIGGEPGSRSRARSITPTPPKNRPVPAPARGIPHPSHR